MMQRSKRPHPFSPARRRRAGIGLGLCALAALALAAPGARAQSGQAIKVGELLSLTGGGAFQSASAKVGAEMARQEINKSGGLLGRQISFAPADDATDPTQALSEAIRLVQGEKIDFMLGPQ